VGSAHNINTVSIAPPIYILNRPSTRLNGDEQSSPPQNWNLSTQHCRAHSTGWRSLGQHPGAARRASFDRCPETGDRSALRNLSTGSNGWFDLGRNQTTTRLLSMSKQGGQCPTRQLKEAIGCWTNPNHTY